MCGFCKECNECVCGNCANAFRVSKRLQIEGGFQSKLELYSGQSGYNPFISQRV